MQQEEIKNDKEKKGIEEINYDVTEELSICLERVSNLNDFRKYERMICVICHNLLWNPIKCADCLLHFCQECIECWTKKNNTCPNCRANFKSEKLERTLKEDLEDTIILCYFKKNGCNESVKYEKVFIHQKQCPFRPSECHWCKLKGILRDITPHELICESRATECLGCKNFIPYKEFQAHEVDCLRKEVVLLREKLQNNKVMIKKKPKKLKFSQNTMFKHDGIQIINKNLAKMKIDEFQKNSVVLLKPKLKNNVVTWKIKISKLTCWIGVGIGNGKTITDTNFLMTDAMIENMKHGSYIISSNGLCWSCDCKSENFIQNFSFKDNDIISLEYDPNYKTLTFMKNGLKKILKLSNNFLNSLYGNIYAIIVLGGIDDTVEIVESNFS